jgi:hypothetical protein
MIGDAVSFQQSPHQDVLAEALVDVVVHVVAHQEEGGGNALLLLQNGIHWVRSTDKKGTEIVSDQEGVQRLGRSSVVSGQVVDGHVDVGGLRQADLLQLLLGQLTRYLDRPIAETLL